VKLAIAALIALAVLVFGPGTAQAHSASDAYLTLTIDSGRPQGMLVMHGQWDVALRDLDFVLKLDEDGDGRLSWGEVKQRQAAIARYVYGYLRIDAKTGAVCEIRPSRQMIDDHADGAYVALFFDVVCKHAAPTLRLHYDLFFAIDPSHRGIFVMHDGANTATAVLSPQNEVIDLAL
jgi:hypothetical protein